MSAVRAPETEPRPAPANGQGARSVAKTKPDDGVEGSLANLTPTDRLLAELLDALRSASAGQADVRLSTRRSGKGKEVAKAFNDFMDLTARYNKEVLRVSRAVGRDGRLGRRPCQPPPVWARGAPAAREGR